MRSLIGLALVVALAAACGGGGSSAAGAEADVRLHDFGIDLDRTSFDAGEVTFRLTNEGPSHAGFTVS